MTADVTGSSPTSSAAHTTHSLGEELLVESFVSGLGHEIREIKPKEPSSLLARIAKVFSFAKPPEMRMGMDASGAPIRVADTDENQAYIDRFKSNAPKILQKLLESPTPEPKQIHEFVEGLNVPVSNPTEMMGVIQEASQRLMLSLKESLGKGATTEDALHEMKSILTTPGETIAEGKLPTYQMAQVLRGLTHKILTTTPEGSFDRASLSPSDPNQLTLEDKQFALLALLSPSIALTKIQAPIKREKHETTVRDLQAQIALLQSAKEAFDTSSSFDALQDSLAQVVCQVTSPQASAASSEELSKLISDLERKPSKTPQDIDDLRTLKLTLVKNSPPEEAIPIRDALMEDSEQSIARLEATLRAKTAAREELSALDFGSPQRAKDVVQVCSEIIDIQDQIEGLRKLQIQLLEHELSQATGGDVELTREKISTIEDKIKAAALEIIEDMEKIDLDGLVMILSIYVDKENSCSYHSKFLEAEAKARVHSLGDSVKSTLKQIDTNLHKLRCAYLLGKIELKEYEAKKSLLESTRVQICVLAITDIQLNAEIKRKEEELNVHPEGAPSRELIEIELNSIKRSQVSNLTILKSLFPLEYNVHLEKLQSRLYTEQRRFAMSKTAAKVEEAFLRKRLGEGSIIPQSGATDTFILPGTAVVKPARAENRSLSRRIRDFFGTRQKFLLPKTDEREVAMPIAEVAFTTMVHNLNLPAYGLKAEEVETLFPTTVMVDVDGSPGEYGSCQSFVKGFSEVAASPFSSKYFSKYVEREMKAKREDYLYQLVLYNTEEIRGERFLRRAPFLKAEPLNSEQVSKAKALMKKLSRSQLSAIKAKIPSDEEIKQQVLQEATPPDKPGKTNPMTLYQIGHLTDMYAGDVDRHEENWMTKIVDGDGKLVTPPKVDKKAGYFERRRQAAAREKFMSDFDWKAHFANRGTIEFAMIDNANIFQNRDQNRSITSKLQGLTNARKIYDWKSHPWSSVPLTGVAATVAREQFSGHSIRRHRERIEASEQFSKHGLTGKVREFMEEAEGNSQWIYRTALLRTFSGKDQDASLDKMAEYGLDMAALLEKGIKYNTLLDRQKAGVQLSSSEERLLDNPEYQLGHAFFLNVKKVREERDSVRTTTVPQDSPGENIRRLNAKYRQIHIRSYFHTRTFQLLEASRGRRAATVIPSLQNHTTPLEMHPTTDHPLRSE